MSTTFVNSAFDLEEFYMIGGSHQKLVFAVYDENGSPLSLNGATIAWKLSYFGTTQAVATVLPTSGSATNQFVVDLLGSQTLSYSGKFVQQYYIIDSSGSLFRPSQGLIHIYPAIS